MIQRMLPLLICLSTCGAIAAQVTPAASRPVASSTQTRTTMTTRTAQPPAGVLSEEAIKTAIADAGHKEVKGLEFKHGA